MFGRPIREPVVSPLAARGGDVYVCTNLGAVAALEARTGTLRWLARYPTTRIPATAGFQPKKREPTFETNPVCATDDVVIVAPSDARACLAFDRRTGERRWGIDRHADPSGDDPEYRFLLGCAGDRVILTGAKVAAFDVATGTLRWSAPDFPIKEDAPVAGRGIVTGTSVYWPTPKFLRRIDLSGRIAEVTPWTRWGAMDAGNLVCVGGTLVIAETAHDRASLVALFAREHVLHDLEARAAARPADPEPLLAAAEVRLQADELGAAAHTLERVRARLAAGALALANPRTIPRSGTSRRRLAARRPQWRH